LVLFVRIRTFQQVTAIPNKKSLRFLPSRQPAQNAGFVSDHLTNNDTDADFRKEVVRKSVGRRFGLRLDDPEPIT
jgi:hypothetical protein